MVAASDLLGAYAAADQGPAQTLAGELMTTLPVTVDGDRLVGLLTVDDLLVDDLYRLFDLLGPISRSILRGCGSPEPTRIRGAGHDQ